MCKSPLSIGNRSAYIAPPLSLGTYMVPCGECEDCRRSVQNEWHVRLLHEYNAFVARGGCGVFLTFTFSNANLPTWNLPSGEVVSCFNRDLVKSFLNNLKVRCWRLFGKNSYKYFFASEYGSLTKRPHHHGFFMLEKNVDYVTFVELCRNLWHHGFMFPKSKISIDGSVSYIDNYGNPSRVLVEKSANCASYVSKYITKDLSFYNLPSVSHYLDTVYRKKKYLNRNGVRVKNLEYTRSIDVHLPKHWQSSGIGECILDNDIDTLKNYIKDGIPNPSSPNHPYVFPSYCLNKLLYKNVKSQRISLTTGKYLYDRYALELSGLYFDFVFSCRFEKFRKKLTEFLSKKLVDSFYSERSACDYLTPILDSARRDVKFLDKITCIHLLLKSFTSSNLLFYYEKNGEKLFDFDFCKKYYSSVKNLKVIKRYVNTEPPKPSIQCLPLDVENLFYVERVICDIMGYYSNKNAEERALAFVESSRCRRLNIAQYDVQLC